jgi:hypothetical protein
VYVTAFGGRQGQAFKTSHCGQHTLRRKTGLASRTPWALDRTWRAGLRIVHGGAAEHDLDTPSSFAGFGSLLPVAPRGNVMSFVPSSNDCTRRRSFRMAIITAYDGRCALSRSPEPLLFDAAHIVADKDERYGQPIVSNGIRCPRSITRRSTHI